MSPDDIRKMLEKRIEERSRKLESRKNFGLRKVEKSSKRKEDNIKIDDSFNWDR